LTIGILSIIIEKIRTGEVIMRNVVLRTLSLILCACFLVSALPARAEETVMAEDISSSDLIVKSKGFNTDWLLFDGSDTKAGLTEEKSSVTLADERGFGSLYLIFDEEYGCYTLTNNDTGEVMTLGENGLLHEFVSLEDCPSSITLSFANGKVKLNEIYAFTKGQVPDYVQKWELPKEGETDLVLFSTHGDDEHLFFAGILPYYAVERGYQVQVVYLTNHRNVNTKRCHEMLNGLWAVGVRTYPVFGHFKDYFSTSIQQAYGNFKYWGVTEEELLAYVVEQVRRFKPKVAVGHDPIKGEYGHGAHMLYADLLMKALEITNDPDQFPESAEKYGLWDVPKTYLHCYPENEIVMDWDQPLESFDGMTAYEVSTKLGFTCHKTQYNDFAWYIAGMKTAAQIRNFGPREFGLYRSTVGEDVEKNDFFENMTTYAEDARIRAEEEARLEAERLEQQRREEEERRLAEEARAREEAAKLAQLELEQKEQERKRMFIAVISGICLVLVMILLGSCIRKRKKK